MDTEASGWAIAGQDVVVQAGPRAATASANSRTDREPTPRMAVERILPAAPRKLPVRAPPPGLGPDESSWRGVRLEQGRGLSDDALLAAVARHGGGSPRREPPDVLHLVVVLRDVPTQALHEEERDLLLDPGSLPHEPVGDVPQRLPDAGLQSGLLLDLPHRRVLGPFVLLHGALR